MSSSKRASGSLPASGAGWGGSRPLLTRLSILPLLGALLACSLTANPPKPTPTPTRAPLIQLGPDSVQLLHTIPWGALTLDGATAAALGFSLTPHVPEQVVPALTLKPGAHTLTYRADPFPPLGCQISMPPATSDTCPLFDPPPKYPVQNQNGSRILDLGATLDALPSSQLTALQQATQAQVAAMAAGEAQMTPGERYLATDTNVASAPAAWKATPRFTLNLDAQDPGPWQGCVTLCDTYPGESLDTTNWSVDAHLLVRWRYTAPDGHIALDRAPAAPADRQQEIRQRLAVNWDGAWRVTLPTDAATGGAPLCAVAVNELNEQLAPGSSAPEVASYTWRSVAAQPAAQGCLLIGGRPETTGGPPAGDTAWALYRFGLLLAANATAQRALPKLPLADANGEALARSLAA